MEKDITKRMTNGTSRGKLTKACINDDEWMACQCLVATCYHTIQIATTINLNSGLTRIHLHNALCVATLFVAETLICLQHTMLDEFLLTD